MADTPTEPHALAGNDIAVGGVRMTAIDQAEPSLVDSTWDKDVDEIPNPIIEGISNEDAWVLIRRFDKASYAYNGMVVFHVEETKKVPSGGLDLTVAPDQEFSPNKFRSQLERLYMGAIISTLAFIKHIARLRSWRESHRTGAFCAVYFAAWAFDYLGFTIVLVLITLIASPYARKVLFPPHPMSLVGSLSGEVTKPNAGVLGSADSITGAPENIRGEAVENEASNFVTALGSIAMNIVMGPDPQGEPNDAEHSVDAPIPDANKMATIVATAKDKAEGVDRPSQDKTKSPMETIMWSKVPPSMHVMTMMNDYWEKSANLLAPTAPFQSDEQRMNLAAMVAPFAVVLLFVSRDFIIRSTTFVSGVAFFGDPLLRQGYAHLNETHSMWKKELDINKFIFHNVPTNPQLALALLRHSETQQTPFPPPPHIAKPPPKSPLQLTPDTLSATGGDTPLGATAPELLDAIQPRADQLEEAGGDDIEISHPENTKRHRLLNLVKGAAKVGVKAGVGVDKIRAKTGNEGAENRVGVLPGKDTATAAGPVEFDARYEGKKGYLRIDTNGAIPTLSFVLTSSHGHHHSHHIDSIPTQANSNEKALWTVPIADIVGLRKHSGFGFKSKLAAGWAIERDIKDSLGITERGGGEWAVTAIPKRDLVFNRLVSLGGQRWEIW